MKNLYDGPFGIANVVFNREHKYIFSRKSFHIIILYKIHYFVQNSVSVMETYTEKEYTEEKEIFLYFSKLFTNYKKNYFIQYNPHLLKYKFYFNFNKYIYYS
jgi:hypothetical protein